MEPGFVVLPLLSVLYTQSTTLQKPCQGVTKKEPAEALEAEGVVASNTKSSFSGSDAYFRTEIRNILDKAKDIMR